ncbi:MAG: hypothetical protein MHMPM18_000536 [Marteilia pararefringens]
MRLFVRWSHDDLAARNKGLRSKAIGGWLLVAAVGREMGVDQDTAGLSSHTRAWQVFAGLFDAQCATIYLRETLVCLLRVKFCIFGADSFDRLLRILNINGQKF